MYLDFYRMKAEPFSHRPLLHWYFEAQGHRRVWTDLTFGMSSGEPLLTVLGDFGIGKTTTCLRMLQFLKKQIGGDFVYVSGSTHEGYSDMLRQIAEKMGLPLEQDDSRLEYSIYRYIAGLDKRTLYLVVDDADKLDQEDLTSLHLLTDFHQGGFFPVQLVLFGGPGLIDVLQATPLASSQRSRGRKCLLKSLSPSETGEYIYFRLIKSGAPGMPSFADKAIKVVSEFSMGKPRVIHDICKTSLEIGARSHLQTIDEAVVRDAIEILDVEKSPPPEVERIPERQEPLILLNSYGLGGDKPSGDAAPTEADNAALPSDEELTLIQWQYDDFMRVAEREAVVSPKAKNKHLRAFILFGGLMIISMLLAILFNVNAILKGLF